MYSLRYALHEFSAPTGMGRGYFDAIASFASRPAAQPGDVMPVCGLVRGVPRLVSAQWSVLATTAHSMRRGQGPETLVRSRTYGPLYHRRQRCLVPASGYYVAARDGAGKRTLYVHARDGGLLAFAALWERDGAEDEKAPMIYTLVSCGRSQNVHVPLILAPEQYDAWLNDEDPRHLLGQRSDRLLAVAEPGQEPFSPRTQRCDAMTALGTARA